MGNRLDILPGKAVSSPTLVDSQSCFISKEERPTPKVEGWKKAKHGDSNKSEPDDTQERGKAAPCHCIQKEAE